LVNVNSTIRVKGSQLVDTTKDLVQDGDVRRLIIKDTNHTTVMEVPVTVGVVGFIVAPTMAAITALAALPAEYLVEVVRERSETEPTASPAATKGADHE